VCVCACACVRVCVNKSCNLNPSVLQITFGISVDAKGQSVLPVVSTPHLLPMSNGTSTAVSDDNVISQYFSPRHS